MSCSELILAEVPALWEVICGIGFGLLLLLFPEMSEGLYAGQDITVEDEFTGDMLEDEEEEDGNLKYDEEDEDGEEGEVDRNLKYGEEEGEDGQEEEGEHMEGPFLLLLAADPESEGEQPPPSRSLQDRVIHIQVMGCFLTITVSQASPDITKPAVTGLGGGGGLAVRYSSSGLSLCFIMIGYIRQEYQAVFLCPEPHCKLRLPTQVIMGIW